MLMTVYIAPTCPFCAHVVKLVEDLAANNDGVECRITDASRALDEAEAIGIRSTPSIVIDGTIRWVGQATADDIAGLLEPASWSGTVGSMAEVGDVEALAELVRRHPAAVAPLADLLQADEMAHRMTVLRVLEEAVGEDEDLARLFLPALGEFLRSDDARLRGDAAYGLGLLGLADAVDILQSAADDPDADVREAVADALEDLQ